jgi:hypothetical protein
MRTHRQSLSRSRRDTPSSGHIEALAMPRLNAGYQFSNLPFAGPRGSYRIAPIPDIRRTAIKSPKLMRGSDVHALCVGSGSMKINLLTL